MFVSDTTEHSQVSLCLCGSIILQYKGQTAYQTEVVITVQLVQYLAAKGCCLLFFASRFPNECSKCQKFYLGKKVFDLQLNKAFKLGTFLLFFSILLSV